MVATHKLLVLFALGLVGCAASPSPAPATGTLAWPADAEGSPQIVFLHEIHRPEDLGIKVNLLSRIVNALKSSQPKDIFRPYGLAKSTDGLFFVVDNAYQAIHVFDMAGKRYDRFPETAIPGFKNPVNIALGSRDRVYVSDSVSGLIHVFAKKDYEFIKSFGADYLGRPTGIAVNHTTGELLVLDTENSTLLVFDEASHSLKKIIGGGQGSDSDDMPFHYPTNIAVTADGDVLISDSLNFRIQRLSADLRLIGEFGNPGNAPGNFSRPKGIATDSVGNIYVVDAIFDNVQVFSKNGELLIAFGSPGKGPGQFWLPNSICIDQDDQIYVSDSYNQRVQVFKYRPAATDAP